ncbi:MAG TPA: hypothetical protein PLS49_08440, partial [Candidatus Woesebacteria bacterium]|nr:hypothetical protein [Candidatus Woesebacteria bacterium]
ITSSNNAVIASEDAFFVMAYPLALTLNETLYFNGSVSKLIFSNVPKVNKLLGLQKSNSRITVTSTTDKQHTGKKASAQFFTLGIDSFHTLLTHKPDYLLFVEGFDVPLTHQELLHDIHSRIRTVAKKTNTTPIFVSTNVRHISDKIISWDLFFGAALATTGLLLSNKIERIWMNGSYFPTDIIHGGTKQLDPLWSTEYMQFLPTGYIETRFEKIQGMKKLLYFDLVQNHLRVCWKNIYDTDIKYNCSRCEKYLRTQFTLLACGEKAQTFYKYNIESLPLLSVAPISLTQWKVAYSILKKNKKTDPRLLTYIHKTIIRSS